jgi:hypothetical protein
MAAPVAVVSVVSKSRHLQQQDKQTRVPAVVLVTKPVLVRVVPVLLLFATLAHR